jgi:maltooligosyltrehalose trehalohydrolase
MRFRHVMPFGATLLADAGCCFRLWAPSSESVELELTQDRSRTLHKMRALEGGWHELATAPAGADALYRFVVQAADGQRLAVPDPASRCNPEGVHGVSRVTNPLAYEWRSEKWRGRPWADALIYELHVGAFTQEGTFKAAERRLSELAELGVNTLQLMPLSAFPGERNWGYDGVLQYAPAACYGSPDELKSFIDAAHGLGMMVLLDVVYNHFGPEGNYLHAYCPQFFNPAHQTPWGAAINYDGAESRTVREFFVQNALYWTGEYQLDGLRLDAVHAIRDNSDSHLVREITHALRLQARATGRHIHVVLENNANTASYLERNDSAEPARATAQWDDDIHHAMHVLTTREADGYYADYVSDPLKHLGRALAEGFAYQGEHSGFRSRARGEPSGHLPPCAFVSFLQNHDMVGNRAFGERIHRIADERLLTAAYVSLLLTPPVPMIFMGEEFAASTPFFYFCDFGQELADSVTRGRRREFERFAAFTDTNVYLRIPDPNAKSTFMSSKLLWEEREQGAHGARLRLVRDLLSLRRRHLSPHLRYIARGGSFQIEAAALRVRWRLQDGSFWQLLVNFGTEAVATPGRGVGEIIYSTGRTVDPAGGNSLEVGAAEITHEPGDPNDAG